jgi:DNA-directed RNA polymerase subunit RPC12/RpoP
VSFFSPREEPLPSDSGGPREYRYRANSTELATGTFACPRCDAPVAPACRLSPADMIVCPYCRHTAAARAFLSLQPPTRPARVVVRVYAAQRKPVASGRGSSGLDGRRPDGSSSL